MRTAPAVMDARRDPVAAPTLVASRLWLDFVNTDDGRRGARAELSTEPRIEPRIDSRTELRADARGDALQHFGGFVAWLRAAGVVDGERAAGLARRAHQQPAGAAAALVDARRVRAALRQLAERGAASDRVRAEALAEINRILGRSAVTRRVDARPDGTYVRAFVSVGDVFAGLMIPVVDSAAESLVGGELARVRRCANPRCIRVFFDATKNGRRRWCDMATCGNRAKAARHRARVTPAAAALGVGAGPGALHPA